MNYRTNAKLIAPALVLGLACVGCAGPEERETAIVESEVETEVAAADTDTTTDMTDETVATETIEDNQIAEVEPSYEPAPERLPQTAGPLPAIGLAGLFSLIAGFGLAVRRRRS